MKTTEPPVTVEETFDVSVERLWNAITNLDEMRQWYFENIDSFEAKVGSKSSFVVHSEERHFTHTWEVIEVIPNQKISYTWTYPEYPGDAVVTFKISRTNSGSHLKVSMEVVEDFPDEIPEFKRESCIGGWNYFINQRLKEYLS